MEPPTPAYVRAIIDHFADAVLAEMDRIEALMREAHPGCRTYRHVYTADAFVGPKKNTIWSERAPLGFVQVRTEIGNIHSVNICADQGTGEVYSEGWPPKTDATLWPAR